MHGMRQVGHVAAVVTTLSALVACGGGSGSSSNSTNNSSGGGGTTASAIYTMTPLVASSSAITALQTDAHLVNAWGLAFNPTADAWIANAGTSTSTIYDGNGTAMAPYSGGPSSIAIPAGSSGTAEPTGVVFNATSQFVISSGGNSAPASFLFATLGGTIEGWAQGADPNSAVIAYDGSGRGSMYTGLTMAKDSSGNIFLYAADFKNATVDVFTASFALQPVGGAFFDAAIPPGYAPYGIQNIPASNGSAQIYVTYAEPANTAQHVTMGAGLGYVAVFDADGTLITTLVSKGALNAPWGVALAPGNFGPLSGALLIGNFGDGAINAYNPTTGASMGPLMLTSTQQLFISGLWALQFGNGVSGSSQPTNTLFFTAGPNGEAAGQYGRIDITGTYTPPSNGGGSMGY